ncbi:hypothetical protein LguiB_020584 [Lonicera macranthoides]
MASSSSNINPNGFSYCDEINLCLAWKQVTRDGTWCDRDNLQTWERMAAIFNEEPKKESSLWKNKVVTPEELAQLWAKVEPSVAKWNRFYNEKERPTSHLKFLIDYPGSRAHYLTKFHSEVEKEMEKHADLMYLVKEGVKFPYKMYWGAAEMQPVRLEPLLPGSSGEGLTTGPPPPLISTEEENHLQRSNKKVKNKHHPLDLETLVSSGRQNLESKSFMEACETPPENTATVKNV